MDANRPSRFFSGESGGTAVEYGLLALLIAVFALLSLEAFGPNLAGFFRNLPQDKSITSKP